MMKAAAITALCIPVLCAATPDYTAGLQTARTMADTWGGHFAQVSTDLQALGIDLSEPADTCEIPATEDTVVVADQGLLFDAASSRLIYLGNVRLRDARAHIDAAEQLHLYLEKPESDDKEEAPTDTPSAVQSEPADTEEETSATTEEAPAEAPAAEAEPSPTPVAAAEPAYISTHYGLADTVNNTILLHSPAEGKEVHLKQGKNEVQILPGDESPARILADPEGNILMEGAEIRLSMTDKNGGLTKLRTTGGHAYYQAATHTLFVPGDSSLTHPQGTLCCTDMLCVKMAPAATTGKSKGFMSQFTGLRFEGISTATASGNVVATGTETEGRPAMRAEGDTLFYDGRTGECSLTGSESRLTYGGYDVYSNEGVHLLPNGDIELRGSNIHGTYERESSQPGNMLQGTFKANAPVVFRADKGTISTSQGLSMQDAEGDFSCTGPAHLVLQAREDAREQETRPGMPNLAIARYRDISHARAEGNVVAHRYEPGTRKCLGELKARTADFDVTTGETLLTGEPGQALVAQYNGNTIVAEPAEGESATMEMRANGDLKLNGAHISAAMQGEGGPTTASCNDYVLLVRAENRLETGSSTVLKSPRAIVTTNGCLHALLTTSETASASNSRFPGFRFNYDGIREASTDKGCTVRTEKGSMQCTGPARIVMNTENKRRDQMLGGMKFATARGEVAVAGKDKTGRLIRAAGDELHVDAATGMKVLSGEKVTLSDANNTHTIYGPGAVIRIDAQNNATFSGARHNTRATNVRQQMNNKGSKSPKK